MKRGLVIVFELCIIAAALFIADALQNRFDVIPSAIIRLPDVSYTNNDFWEVFRYFLSIHLLLFLIVHWRIGPWLPADGKRTAEELFCLAAGFAFSALAVFVTTTVAFDPNFIVWIAVCSAVLMVFVFVAAQIVNGSTNTQSFLSLPRGILQRMFSIVGVLTLVLAISPAILAKLFVSDRDIANRITQVRIFFGGSIEAEYSLINALDGQVFQQPLLVRNVPGNSNRIMVLERPGRIISIDYPSGGNRVVELNIVDKVGVAEVENGALGFDFHPEFGVSESANSNNIYVYYTEMKDGVQVNRLSRFEIGQGDDNERSRSEQPLLVLPREPSGFHNGGSVDFGPDGYLYLALGEGVRPNGVSSLALTLRQGILRLDVDQKGGEVSHAASRFPRDGSTANYFIPNDNPFVGNSQLLEEYWAIGLRNPFRMAFDPLTGALWVGDVGSTKWEEVNLVSAGGHMQFPFIQGFEATSSPKPETIIGVETPPLYTYVHTAFDRAVIGGIVYRGSIFPELQGRYIFADNYSSKIFSMRADGQPVSNVDLIAQAGQFAQRGVSSVAELDDGSIVVTTLGRASLESGEVLTLTRGNLVDEGESAIDSNTVPVLDAVSPAEADSLYNANCSRCHGASGAADGPDSTLLDVDIADLSSDEFQSSRTDENIAQVIRVGGAAAGLSPLMPPWQHILNDNEISALVEKVRSLRPEE